MAPISLVRVGSDLHHALTALALFALFATFALPVWGSGLAAYTPDHEHLTLAGYVPANHVHPWDAEALGATTHDEASADLVFTLGTDGDAASGWASATLTPELHPVVGPVVILESAIGDDVSPAAASLDPVAPPPRV